MNTIPIKFEIKSLGAIRDSFFKLKPFMIFSGESGLGKSYIAFLTHYFYLLLAGNRLENFFVSKGYILDLSTQDIKDKAGLVRFNPSELYDWVNQDAVRYLGYILGHNSLKADIKIHWELNLEEFLFTYEVEVATINNKEQHFLKVKFEDQFARIRYTEGRTSWGGTLFTLLLRDFLQKQLFGSEDCIDATFLMPPSRGALIGLTLSSQDKITATAGMYEEFLIRMEEFQFVDWTSVSENNQRLLGMITKINNGNLKYIDDKLVYSTLEEAQMPVSAAASSVKELAPLALFLQGGQINSSVLFEEPEAHLHPQKQVEIAELISAIVMEGAHFQITTHSDYFVRKINDLITLHKLKGLLSEKDFESLCSKYNYSKDIVLNPELVGAYLLQRRKDGSVEIVEQDTTLGVPYDTFQQVIIEDVSNSQKLKSELNQLMQGE
ncbi:AAA family ATPase [Bacteroides sp. 519]|uniref:AAA family ATPase n=1 Tax=Bacteroides sp. 519 TaxID=2302937 RepID=UPI0013D4B799|nr:AAA family ATPase [Bacteroides sp. 519]NDV57209.1 hypothetical protein [Bacteroides sp. 519]